MRNVIFVCWGNICRSPIAERVARSHFAEAGLDDVEVRSAGTSTEELGNPIDPRAVRVLQREGHDARDHAAHQISAEEIAGAELVVAMENVHVERMEQITGRQNPNVSLLTDFDPEAEPGSGVPDPWYGGDDGFDATLASVTAAMPGLVEHLRGEGS